MDGLNGFIETFNFEYRNSMQTHIHNRQVIVPKMLFENLEVAQREPWNGNLSLDGRTNRFGLSDLKNWLYDIVVTRFWISFPVEQS